jgi:hypothetical protein
MRILLLCYNISTDSNRAFIEDFLKHTKHFELSQSSLLLATAIPPDEIMRRLGRQGLTACVLEVSNVLSTAVFYPPIRHQAYEIWISSVAAVAD